MGKKIIGLTCVLVLVTVFILVKIPSEFAIGSTAQTYSLEDVINKTLSSSSALKLLGEKITLAEKKRDNTAEGIERDKKVKELEDLREQLYQKQNASEIEVTKLYYQILIKDQAINVQNSRVARLAKELQIKEKQVELGNDTQASLLAFKVSIADGQAKLTSLKNEREKLVMSLNVYMGSDVKTSVILKSRDVPETSVDVSNIAQLAEDLSLKSYSITSNMKLHDINQRDLANKKSSNPPATTSTVLALQEEILKIGYAIEDEKDAIEVKVRTDYNDILNSKDTVNVKRLDYEKNLKLAQIAKIKYDLGMIIYTEYSKAQEDADDSLWAYHQAKLDYYVLVQQYKNYIKPAQ